MTKTELLLVLLGGIFVVEALSVLIQVFSFQTFRKRVFLMAPIHHHFELHVVVGDEDHPALLDHRRDLQRDRVHAVPAVDHVSAAGAPARPVPRRRPGAQSGVAALRRAAGARPRGGRRRRGHAGRRPRRACTWAPTASTLLDGGVATVVKSPGVPQEAPVVAAARERGHHGHGRARARVADAAQPVRRGDRDERQDDDGRAARRTSTARRGSRSRWPATSARRSPASTCRPTPSSSPRRPRSSSRTRSPSRPRRPRCSTSTPRPPRPPRHVRGLPRGQAPGLRAPDARRSSPCCPTASPRPGDARRVRFGGAPTPPTCASTTTR